MKKRDSNIAADITSWGFYSYLVLYMNGMVARRKLFLFGNHEKRAEQYRDAWLWRREYQQKKKDELWKSD